MARTIDNLGVDISTQYAESRQAYDETFLKESREIQVQTKIDVTLPFLPSEFETMFGLGKRGAMWSTVAAPPGYYTSRKSLFTEQILPRFGSPEAQENQLERLRNFGMTEVEKHAGSKEIKEVSREHATLITLLETLHTLNADLLEINPKRVQYQRG